MKPLLSTALALLLFEIPAVQCRNHLRQAKEVKEWRVFDPKAAKVQKADKAGKTTDTCGELWHLSQSANNPNSCTNDNNLPGDPSKLYLTVQECCKAEFGKVHGCNVYNACRQTPQPKPTPTPTRFDPDCSTLWHLSQSPSNPNSCTNDHNLLEDPSKLYSTVQECCRAEFGRVQGCNVYNVCRQTLQPKPTPHPTRSNSYTEIPTPFTPDTGDELPPTDHPTSSPITEFPMSSVISDEDSRSPSALLRTTLAGMLNDLYESPGSTAKIQTQKELRDVLGKSGIEPNKMEDVINSASNEASADSSNIVTNQISSDIVLDHTDSSKCTCVDCLEDARCGGLWKGTGHYVENATNEALQIHIVVSHCKSPLGWLEEFLKGFAIESIHVITKCGNSVLGAPDEAVIIEMPNVGRCDHTYAWFISNILPQLVPLESEENPVIVFLKDDISQDNMHQLGKWSEFGLLTRLASSDQGFACGINSMDVRFSQERYSLSAFHETKTLGDFAMDSYQRNLKGYANDSTEFRSQFETLGAWWASLDINPTSDLSMVCYGGVFAATVGNIRKHSQQFWASLESNLSRGNNIQEGHYAERSWAMLLTTPLQPFQVKALFEHADGVYVNMSSMHGALMKRSKLFLHIGAKATSSTEILSESIIKHLPNLTSDGYRVAIHGQYNPLEHDFPNIDRLASCMWSDQIKQSFPYYMRDATECPQELLPQLSSFMNKAVEEHHDMVILNPWLSRRGTADSLSLFLGNVWDVHAIIYYRRYFEWITLVHEEWRGEILEHTLNLDQMPFSSFRYIDFIREYCKRLFYGEDVHEDGYPIRSFSGTESGTLFHDDITVEHYHPTSKTHVEDLTDLLDYTYFVAKDYSSNSRFRRHLTIVNYHEATHRSDTNFFCQVLHDAHNTCRAAAEEELALNGHANAEDVEFSQTEPFPIPVTQAVEDLVIYAVKTGRIRVNSALPSENLPTQLRLLKEHLLNALEQSGKPTSDLPIECLYNFEVDRLLEVSLAYEKSLLPAFYGSLKGATNLIQEFGRWKFCSVNTEKVLNDARWDFLFNSTAS